MGFGPIQFGGLASGLDTGSIISALMALERRPIQLLESRKSTEESKLELFSTFENLVRELRDKDCPNDRAIWSALAELVFGGLVAAAPETPVLTRPRHASALRTALDELEAFARALADGVPAEIASTHLRPAETALEELLGTISVDDVLDRVFGEFCIGK